jgi:Family of unknown function (DUF6295)
VTEVCTYVTERIAVHGSGKAGGEWVPVASASVYMDHPYATPLDHTLNIDVFTDRDGRSRHVALELSLESAQALLGAISRALEASVQKPGKMTRSASRSTPLLSTAGVGAGSRRP